jgi:hypothetical protein
MKMDKNTFGHIFIVLWALLVLSVFLFVMPNHFLALRSDRNEINLTKLSHILFVKDSSGMNNKVVHIISESCSCTNSMVRHLISRGPNKNSNEYILFVGGQTSLLSELLKAGFRVHQISRLEITNDIKIKASPALLVLDSKKNDSIQYFGGYYKTSSLLNPEDENILSKLNHDEKVQAYPIYGCSLLLPSFL